MNSTLNALLSTFGWLGTIALCAFLAIFWLLRGSPLGQSAAVEDDADAPASMARDRIILAVTGGMVLIVLGVVIALSYGVGWSLMAFVPGFLAVLGFVSRHQKHRHTSQTLRRTFELSGTILNATLLGGILVVFNVVAFRYGSEGIDLTREAAFSLSSLTVKQLTALDRPLTFTTFFGRGPAAAQQAERVRQLLELYKTAAPSKVRVIALNPYYDIEPFETLLKRVPEVAVTQGGGVVVELGEGEKADRVVLRNADLFDRPGPSPYQPTVSRFESVFKGEDAVTSAISRLREGVKPKIAFTSGHGEVPINPNDPSKPGLGLWKGRLAAMGAEVFEINLLTAKIPEDLAVLIVAGPQSKFQPEEISKLQGYLYRQKPLLLIMNDAAETGLESVLESFQVKLETGVILDSVQNYRGFPDMVSVPVVAPENPLVAPLLNRRLLFSRAAPIVELKERPRNAPPAETDFKPVVVSSKTSWSEPDVKGTSAERSDKAKPGPFVLGAAIYNKPDLKTGPNPAPRLVVYSSRLFAIDRLVQIESSNLDLLMNTIGLLRNRDDLLGIAPKTHVSMTLTADPKLRAKLVLVPTILSFLLILSVGLWTYLARRS